MAILGLSIGLFVIVLLRYFFFAGGLYWLCWKRNRDAWGWRRIQSEFPDPRILRAEIRWSVITSAVFALSGAVAFWAWQRGWTRIYLDVAKHGWPYFFFSMGLLAWLHDTYFYWTHRWMHLPRFYRLFHKVHHDSRNPTPWAAFSFHPTEAVIEAIILPALVFVIPVHPAAFMALLMFMTVLGVVNHTGYELYPRSFARNRFWKHWISATHHQMHHRRVTCNYGLYFTIWDRWMGTHHATYEEEYDAIQARRPL